MEAEIRRHETTLIYSGYAVIAFGLWSIIRTVLMRLMDPAALQRLFFDDASLSLEEYGTVLYWILLVLLVLDLLYRTYLGMSAVREGQGQKKKWVYVVLAFLYAEGCVVGDVRALISPPGGVYSLDLIVGTVVDLTSCVALLEIVWASVHLRLLKKKAAESRED